MTTVLALTLIAVGIFIGSTVTCATALYLDHKSSQKLHMRGLALELAMENDWHLDDAKEYIKKNNL